MSRLRERYEKEVVPALRRSSATPTSWPCRKIKKVVVNMGLGEAT